MYYDQEAGLELFQDLDQLLLNPVNNELIEPSKITSELVCYNPRTIQTKFSPQDWDNDASSSNATRFYNSSPIHQMLPNNKIDIGNSNNLAFKETFVDINNLSEVYNDLNPDMMNIPMLTNTHDRMPLVMFQDDAMDIKYPDFYETQENNNNMAKAEYISTVSVNHGMNDNKQKRNLMLNMPTPGQSWYSDVISTPDVLNYVEQLETNNDLHSMVNSFPVQEFEYIPEGPCAPTKLPLTPKSELEDSKSGLKPFSSKKRRHSEDSDEVYIPYSECKTPKKYKQQHKPDVPTKDLTLALERLQQSPKVKRGRPPKRRNSVISVCSSESRDINMSPFTPDTYRMLRDKNNEASKRSRMKKKLKEMEMEKIVLDMETRNRELKAKVVTLEELTKKLREIFKSILLDAA